MSSFEIPDTVIDATASQIHAKTNKDYKIPVVGVADNLETPQVFEIMPFTEIDRQESRFYAIDGSRNSHSITYAYDQLNRLRKKTYPAKSTVIYTYENARRLTQVADPP